MIDNTVSLYRKILFVRAPSRNCGASARTLQAHTMCFTKGRGLGEVLHFIITSSRINNSILKLLQRIWISLMRINRFILAWWQHDSSIIIVPTTTSQHVHRSLLVSTLPPLKSSDLSLEFVWFDLQFLFFSVWVLCQQHHEHIHT